MGLRHAVTASGTNNAGSQVSVDAWNQDHQVVGDLDIPVNTSPGTPAADFTKLFAKKIANKILLSQKGPSGIDSAVQAALHGNRIYFAGGTATTTLSSFGFVFTNTGTLTARASSATNVATRSVRTGLVSAATAGSLASARHSGLICTMGAGAGLGGFFFRSRIMPSNAAAVSGERFFYGLRGSTAAASNVEPNTLTNSIGIAQLSTDTNLRLYVTGGTANANSIDLGANFPAAGLSANLYDIAFFAPPDGTLYYRVERVETGAVAEGQLTTGLPTNSTFLTFNSFKTNNATALAVAWDYNYVYLETDN